eukprot:768353-Hanusia_phi.AAC.1
MPACHHPAPSTASAPAPVASRSCVVVALPPDMPACHQQGASSSSSNNNTGGGWQNALQHGRHALKRLDAVQCTTGSGVRVVPGHSFSPFVSEWDHGVSENAAAAAATAAAVVVAAAVVAAAVVVAAVVVDCVSTLQGVRASQSVILLFVVLLRHLVHLYEPIHPNKCLSDSTRHLPYNLFSLPLRSPPLVCKHISVKRQRNFQQHLWQPGRLVKSKSKRHGARHQSAVPIQSERFCPLERLCWKFWSYALQPLVFFCCLNFSPPELLPDCNQQQGQ